MNSYCKTIATIAATVSIIFHASTPAVGQNATPQVRIPIEISQSRVVVNPWVMPQKKHFSSPLYNLLKEMGAEQVKEWDLQEQRERKRKGWSDYCDGWSLNRIITKDGVPHSWTPCQVKGYYRSPLTFKRVVKGAKEEALSPMAGCRREAYQYRIVKDIANRYNDENNPTTSLSIMTVVADVPSGDNKSRHRDLLYQYLDELMDNQDLDTAYYVEGRPTSIQNYVARLAAVETSDKDIIQVKNISPEECRKSSFLNYNVTHEYIWPVMMTKRHVTWGNITDMSYFAGGGGQTIYNYATYDVKTGRKLDKHDIFTAGKEHDINICMLNYFHKIIRSSKEADLETTDLYLMKDLVDAIYGISEDEWPEENRMSILSDYVSDENPTLFESVALADNGIIAMFDISNFTDIGEDSIIGFLIPWNVIGKYIRPEIRNAVGV